MATLAVKYRPQTFGDVVEQNVIKAILQNQIKDNAIKNCYLFCGPAGCGKAQPLYSKVLTPNGFITMGEVTTDTKVITRNGNVTDVVNVYPQGIRKVYEIRLSDGTSIRVADNHLNSVYIYNDKAQRKDLVLETESLINLMDSISNKVYVDIPVVYFNEESNNYKGAYELGLKLGNLNNTNKTLDFGIDEEFLLSAKKTRTALFDGIINSIYGKESTGNDRIAVIYSEVLSKNFEFLVRSLGYYDEVSVTTDKTYIHNIKRSSIRYITYIRYIGEEECQCIYVADSDHTYISDNFIPTHNTTNARLFAKEINGSNSLITELDAASHNGVEDVRKLIEDSKFKPIGCKYRVYIIDECVTGDTEILTKDGWKRIDSISENEVVAQYVHNKGIEFVSIDEYVVKDYSGDMYEVSFGDNNSVTMSPHHVQVVIDPITHEISEKYIQDIDFTDKGIITINYDSDGSYGIGRYYSKNITKNKISNYCGKIYCVKVPSHMIILRVNDFAFVSGNCHALSNSAWQAMLKCLEEPTPTSINVFCLEENGLVCTESEIKKIKDVSVGDKVFTGDGFHFVSNVFDNGERECIKITLANGETIKCTPDHKFKVLDGTQEVWKEASSLTTKDNIAIYHSCCDYEDIPNITDTECWFLGYLTGNGHYRRQNLEFFTPKNKIDFVHSKLDDAISEGWFDHYEDVRFNGSITTQLHFPHGSLLKWYEKTGCDYTYKRGTKSIPKCVYKMSTRQILLFVQGWFDADGCGFGNNFFESKPHPMLYCSSEKMVSEIQIILTHHGFNVRTSRTVRKNVNLPDGRVHSGNSCLYSIYLSHQSGYFMDEKLKEWMLDHRFVSSVPHINDARKLKYGNSRISSDMVKESQLPDLQGNKWYTPIKSIENCEKCHVYDIEVPDVHEFIYNGVKAHNCTTDPQKIPATIISRIQRYDFQKITHAGIVNRLKYIISKENEDGCNYTYDEEAISYIAKLADGGMRDSITLLEKTLAYNPNVTMESVTKALGTVDYNVMFDLTDAICKMDKKSVIEIIEGIHRDGLDLKQFIKNYNYFVLDLCKYDILREFEYLQIPSVYSNRMNYSKEDYAFFTTLLNEVINLNSNIKWESTPKPIIESTFILLCSEA